jgi:hypothetical protein
MANSISLAKDDSEFTSEESSLSSGSRIESRRELERKLVEQKVQMTHKVGTIQNFVEGRKALLFCLTQERRKEIQNESRGIGSRSGRLFSPARTHNSLKHD